MNNKHQRKLITVVINDPFLIDQIDFIVNDLGSTRQEVISGVITMGLSAVLECAGNGNLTPEKKRTNLQLIKK